MRLSTKFRYGVRALVELARHRGSGPTKRRTIAEIQSIPDSYLENIMVDLRNARIVRTVRGANGGYELLASPSSVTFYDVVTALEGVETFQDADIGGSEPVTGIDQAVIRLWCRVREAEEHVLRGMTIQDVVDEERYAAQPEYCI